MAKQPAAYEPRDLLTHNAKYTITAGTHPEDLRADAAILARVGNHLLGDGTEAIERATGDANKAARVYGLELLHTAAALLEMSGAFYAAAAHAAGERP